MKKLLVLLILVGLTTMASAAVLELSVDGVTNGAGNQAEIFLDPSDEVVIDVYASAAGANDEFWLGIEGSGEGEWLSTGTAHSPPGPEGVTVSDGGYGDKWLYYEITDPGTYIPETGVWYEVTFHCTGPDDVIINLYDEDGLVVEDSILVHQPEPMTVALLGLGGLFLRRRK